jgi:hypothetical protein
VKAPGVFPEARTAREDDTAVTEAQASLEEYRADLITVVTNHGLDAAQRGDPDAFDGAIAAIRDAAELGSFSADDVVFPGSRRVLGSAFSFLRKSGELECIGYAISRRPARHGGLCRQWRAV